MFCVVAIIYIFILFLGDGKMKVRIMERFVLLAALVVFGFGGFTIASGGELKTPGVFFGGLGTLVL